MNFILLPAGSGGFCLEWKLAKWFPPRLTSLDSDAHKEVLAYQYRIGRKGVERHPTMFAGAQIVRVIEGEAKPKTGRRNISCKVCSSF
jgi:hypothetical protein